MSEKKFNTPISERVALEDLRTVPNPRPTTWGPPPLHAFLVEDQQQMVSDNHKARLEASRPADTSPSVATEVHEAATNHFAARMLAGYDNFEGAQHLDVDLTVAERRIVNRALAGRVNPAEIAFVTDKLGIRGAPYGVASHYYGRNMKQLETLRRAHDRTVTLFSGKKLNSAPTYKIKNARFDPFSDDLTPNEVLITRKRNLARLADHVIDKERSDIILVTSGLTPSLLAELAEMVSDEEAIEQEITRGQALHTAISSLLRSDKHRLAVPVDTTIYTFNESAPAVPAMDPSQSRKRHPNIGMIMTRKRLIEGGVPVNDFEAAKRMPLRNLIAPKKK